MLYFLVGSGRIPSCYAVPSRVGRQAQVPIEVSGV